MRKFYIIENNAGGIEMFVATEDGNLFEGWFAGYEVRRPESLKFDIAEIFNGSDNINMWDGNIVNEEFDGDLEYATAEINEILGDEINNTVILEGDSDTGGLIFYPDVMSNYAKEIFGLEVE